MKKPSVPSSGSPGCGVWLTRAVACQTARLLVAPAAARMREVRSRILILDDSPDFRAAARVRACERSGPQVSEHSEDAAVLIGRLMQAELVEDPCHVPLHCGHGDHQLTGNGSIRTAFRNQSQYLALALG
jgi:hypothetical protein